MHTITKNITTPIYRNLSLVLIVSIMALTACEGDGSTSPSTISAVETAKRATTDVRDSYGIFTLKTDTGTVTDYHLVVKEKSATAPTAKEMTDGALKRNISPTAIHVLIAQRLNAPMVSFAKAYFADNTAQTLGTDMSASRLGEANQGFGTVYDNTATGANAWVKESVLKPSTAYSLYGMKNGETTVSKLLDFSTDATSALGSTGTAVNAIGYVDSTLAQGHITLSVNPNELYIFPTQSDTHTTTPVSAIQVYFSQQVASNQFLLINTLAVSGRLDAGYKNVIYMMRNLGNNTHSGLGGHVLLDTTNYKNINYGTTLSIIGGTSPPVITYSTLSPQ